jgi:hypothetical protein
LRRRARNIFEVSDEAWTQDEVLRADPGDARPDPVSSEPEPRASDEDWPVEERHRPRVFRRSLSWNELHPSGRHAFLLGSALIAGTLVVGAGVLPDGVPERPRSQATVDRRTPGIDRQVPATPAEGNARRPTARAAGPASRSATLSSASTKPRRLRAVRTSAGPEPSLLPDRTTPTRVAQSAETLALGHEFSFER